MKKKLEELAYKLDHKLSFEWKTTAMILSKIVSVLSLLMVFPTILSCGALLKLTKPKAEKPKITKDINEKFDVYMSLLPEQQDDNGFVMHSHCDATLFSGLLGSTPYVSVNLDAANKNGKWSRRPYVEGKDTCFPKNSRSTISRDMFLGILFYILENRRLDLAEEILQYGLRNSWIMGDGEISRTYLTPNMRVILTEIIYKLSGKDSIRRYTNRTTGRTEGYQAHLDVVAIILFGRAAGGIHDGDKEVLKYQYERQPKNALYSYAYHLYHSDNLNEAVELLMDEAIFPHDRLPTSEDRYEGWIFQRDAGSDWQPSQGSFEQHSGADFIFLYWLIFGDGV